MRLDIENSNLSRSPRKGEIEGKGTSLGFIVRLCEHELLMELSARSVETISLRTLAAPRTLQYLYG